jgi:hypothetical protein
MQSIDNILPTEITFMLLVRACQDNGMVGRATELVGTGTEPTLLMRRARHASSTALHTLLVLRMTWCSV